MSSIDDLFKKPVLPSQKRKLDPLQDPNQIYKSPKLQNNQSARSQTSQQVTVEDEADDADADMEAGPELPPDFDEDQEAGADEEGRFFGGGVSGSTADAMRYLDNADEQDAVPEEEKIDIVWLRRTALAFEKKINKNAELRAKFENDAQKFMGSEADLDAEIKSLSLLSEHTELYAEFAKLGCAGSLVSLLAHENTDIAIDAIQIVGELIDEDVQADENQWNSLVDGFIAADLLGLLHANLERLDEEQEEDRAGVYNVLSVLESLASRASLADRIGENETALPWLMNRAKTKEKTVSQNKQYSAEVCAILLQTSAKCRNRFIQSNGVDTFLQLLSAYRKRDPERDTEEEEYVENLFDSVACVLDEPEGKQKFLDAEGTELCLIMLHEGKMSKPRALRLLDHAAGGSEGRTACASIVEAAGLKPLFTTIMKKSDAQSTEHILGIFASMLRSLPADSAPRIRLLAKFVEKEYQKITRLVEIRQGYAARLRKVDDEIQKERSELPDEAQEELADEWLSRRLDAGLFTAQTVDIILAWIAAEDEGAHVKVSAACDIDTIRTSLKHQASDAEDEIRDMLQALVKAI